MEQECNLYTYNQTDPFHIGNTYGGLPTNLMINGIGWTVLMLMFLVVRKNAYKFIQLRNLERAADLGYLTRITQLFFSGNTGPGSSPPSSPEPVGDDSNVSRGEDSPDQDVESGRNKPDLRSQTSEVTSQSCEAGGLGAPEAVLERADEDEEDKTALTPEAVQRQRSLSIDEGGGFWSGLGKVFTLTDHQLMKLAGKDAVQYLRFQRYIIVYIFITTFLSLCVILPLNFQGTLQGNATEFGHTTLSNLDPESPFLWVHITIAFLLFPIAIYTMRRFSIDLKFRDPGLEITRTVCIENIPKHMCKDVLLQRHFAEAYPRIEVGDIKIVYDVEKLTEVDAKLRDYKSSYLYSTVYKENHEDELSMYPFCASRCCCCFCAPCTNKVSVHDYYQEKVDTFTSDLEKQREMALHSPIGMAFVTFKSVNDSKQVFEDHESSVFRRCNSSLPLSSLSTSMKCGDWKVWFAPPPRDIYWEHLSVKKEWMLVKTILSNLFLFFVAFFLTTPEYAVSQLDTLIIAIFGPEYDINKTGGSWIQDFVPTLLLWSFTALLPLLVAYSDRWLGRFTRSEENHSVMRKTFWYLLFMVILLPTFGFTTAKAYFDFIFMNSNSTDTYKWECIFLPDSGAFFVNYVITAALIGSGLELIRFPEMFYYWMQLCFSKTEAEGPAIQRAVMSEFRFGEQYARMLLIFSMVMMYSLSCPLITPFGCLYFVLKHFADRHNLAYVYARSKISKKVHASAINFVIMAVGLLQFFMVVFSIVRSGNIAVMSARTKYALVLFVITINIFTAQIWSAFCRRLSPIKYLDVLFVETGDDEHDQAYVPPVLKEVYPGFVEGEEGPQSPTSPTSPLDGYGGMKLGIIPRSVETEYKHLI